MCFKFKIAIKNMGWKSSEIVCVRVKNLDLQVQSLVYKKVKFAARLNSAMRIRENSRNNIYT